MAGRILLVDDDRDFIRIAEALLKAEGFDVHAETSALGGLEAASRAQPPFDVVLSDVELSSVGQTSFMTGYDFILHLRKDPLYSEIPMAMLTGRRSRQDVERALQVGARDYILKPIHPDIFIAKVKELVARSVHVLRSQKFAEVAFRAPTRVQVWTLLKSIGIKGGTLESDSPLQIGEPLELQSESLAEIGIKMLNGEVVDCSLIQSTKTYLIRFKLLSLKPRDEMVLKRLVSKSSSSVPPSSSSDRSTQ